MIINNKFQIRQIVYLITDIEQNERLVTGIVVKENDLLYELVCGTVTSEHFEFEISDKHNVMITSTN